MELREKISKLFVDKDREFRAQYIKEKMAEDASGIISGLAPALIGGGIGATALGKGMQSIGKNSIEKDRNTAIGAAAGGVGGASLASILSLMHPELTEGVG